MAERHTEILEFEPTIFIEKCESGFMVVGDQYGGGSRRAFSTPEGLIDWLSRELGAGPIVWALTLDFWREMAGIEVDDLVPMPDPSVDYKGYQMAIQGNAMFLLHHFLDKELEAKKPPTPPKKKPGKPKKITAEKPKEEPKKE